MKSLKILITGASGAVGQALALELLRDGHEILAFGRSSEKQFRERFPLPSRYWQWARPTEEDPPFEAIQECDVLIHLQGENVGTTAWDDEGRVRIRSSRVESSKRLVTALKRRSQLPRLICSASAIGIYGDRSAEELTEESTTGAGFLADVTQEWESAWDPLRELTRVVNLRIGVVLDAESGMLDSLTSLFQNGLGGRVGDGQQWMSWVHLRDLVRLFQFCISNEHLRGPINATAPEPIQNRDFTALFAGALKVPALAPPAPAFALKLALGAKSSLALASQKVISSRSREEGFEFRFPQMESALRDLYDWKKSAQDQLLRAVQWVPQPVETVFEFFSSEKNLEALTPEFLNFKVLGKDTDVMQKGTHIDYRLSLHGIPIRWRTLIEEWQPTDRFVDTQLKGPYSKWYHTHRFEAVAGGTLMFDEVVYRVPMGFLGRWVAGWKVTADVQKIFRYRFEKVAQLFPSPEST